MGQMIGSGLTERLSNFTMRATGLSFWTDMLRTAVRMEFGAELARNADRPFADLNPGIRTIFERRGINAQDWDHLRAPAGRFETDTAGVQIISPHTWRELQDGLSADRADDLMLKLTMAGEEKLNVLIPSSNLEAQTRILAGTSAGTIGGEVLRGATMFRGYSMSLMIGQYRQFAAMNASLGTKAGLAAITFGGLTVLGALSVQLKELAKGNDPRPMTDLPFWKAAVFQGGGLGIFGDFFASEENRIGGGLPETIMGPQASLAGDVLRLVASNANRLSEGKTTSVGRDVTTLIRRNTPFFSSAWMTRAAWDRVASDTLQSFLDPEAKTQWRQWKSRMARDKGNKPFIERGAAGVRAPNLSNIGATQ
jgi:hypothetical protein